MNLTFNTTSKSLLFAVITILIVAGVVLSLLYKFLDIQMTIKIQETQNANHKTLIPVPAQTPHNQIQAEIKEISGVIAGMSENQFILNNQNVSLSSSDIKINFSGTSNIIIKINNSTKFYRIADKKIEKIRDDIIAQTNTEQKATFHDLKVGLTVKIKVIEFENANNEISVIAQEVMIL